MTDAFQEGAAVDLAAERRASQQRRGEAPTPVAPKPRPSRVRERERLPEEMREVYDRLMDEYQQHCIKHHGHPFASPKVLADLIRGGWRPATTEASA